MEAIYLQSMTDFVIQQRSELMFKELGKACCKYADFLKKPLQLGFFVPCDENGNVLSEPKELDKYCKAEKCNCANDGEYERDCSFIEYKKAKEKVLFEGFELLSNFNSLTRLRNKEGIDVSFDRYGCYLEPFDGLDGKRCSSIEGMVYLSPKLTPTAIKQIQP